MKADAKPRIGIFAGTFDPVHSGHLGFALHARDIAALDEVCFVPERLPRHKPNAEHFGHRVAMLRRAVKPYECFSLAELVDKNFTVRRTLPQLKRLYGDAKLVLMMGSDTFHGLSDWPHVNELLSTCEFVVGVRSQHDVAATLETVRAFDMPLHAITMVDGLQPGVSSTQVRRALQLQVPTCGVLPSVRRYAQREWLYTRVPRSA